MILQKLRLQDFRSYKKKEFEFSPQTTLVVGPNTSGKSNLLEGIYLLSSGKSFRAGLENEMIDYKKQIGRVKGRVIDDERCDLDIILTRGELDGKKVARKRFLVNGVGRRMADFVGKLRAVYFGPQNLDLVTSSPSLRRRYLDASLGQVDSEYTRASLSYEKGLRQRNRLLENIREGATTRSQLLFWDQLLIKAGDVISQKREEFIDFLNEFKIPSLDFQLVYGKSIISPARLEEYAQEEVAAAATLVGPHRDDFGFRIETRDLGSFGSRGEQRLAVLWLKLGELEFISKKAGERPILLLDDVFSELDHAHRKLVLKVIPKQQTIVTTADIHLVEKVYQKKMELVKLG